MITTILQPEQTPKRPTDSDDEDDNENTQPIIKKPKSSSNEYASNSIERLNRLIKADAGEITAEERMNIIQFVDNEDLEVSL